IGADIEIDTASSSAPSVSLSLAHHLKPRQMGSAWRLQMSNALIHTTFSLGKNNKVGVRGVGYFTFDSAAQPAHYCHHIWPGSALLKNCLRISVNTASPQAGCENCI
ncbi:hypothetical protein N0O89_28820, partial [Mesorhizobium sp. P13.3]